MTQFQSKTFSKNSKRENKKALILKSAERVFARRGFRGARLAEIADEANLPKTNILYYFESKEQIYRAVCQDVLDVWLNALGDISDDAEPDQALERYIKAKMDLSLKRPEASKVFAMEIISGAPMISDYLSKDLKSWVDKQVSVFEVWKVQGLIRDVSPTHVLFMIWAVTQTYADFQTQIKAVLGTKTIDKGEFDKAVATITEVMLRGLGTR